MTVTFTKINYYFLMNVYELTLRTNVAEDVIAEIREIQSVAFSIESIEMICSSTKTNQSFFLSSQQLKKIRPYCTPPPYYLTPIE